MNQNLIILSAGKFGREIFTWAQQAILAGAPFRIKGFLDDRSDILDGYQYENPILGTIENYLPEDGDRFICAIGDPALKRHYCSLLEAKEAKFATLIHPTAQIGRDVVIGEGSIIAPFTQLSCDIQIGKHVTLGTFSGSAHDTRIGNWCQISGHCGINGNAVLEDGVFLGSHVCILPEAKVGAWSYVGAGSVVLRRVAPHTKVFGNPAVSI